MEPFRRQNEAVAEPQRLGIIGDPENVTLPHMSTQKQRVLTHLLFFESRINFKMRTSENYDYNVNPTLKVHIIMSQLPVEHSSPCHTQEEHSSKEAPNLPSNAGHTQTRQTVLWET